MVLDWCKIAWDLRTWNDDCVDELCDTVFAQGVSCDPMWDFCNRQVVNRFRLLQRWYWQARGVCRYARSRHGYLVGPVDLGDDPS